MASPYFSVHLCSLITWDFELASSQITLPYPKVIPAYLAYHMLPALYGDMSSLLTLSLDHGDQ